ncbi:MAG TPA: hypothetical protein VFI86_08910 [Burkholderiales bacterium]|nr:hypothetical protein [Burkholderiales bacterium]
MRSMTVLALCALACAFTLPARAEGTGAYLVSKGGIVKTGKGLCMRTSRWTEQNADPACKDALRQFSTASRR